MSVGRRDAEERWAPVVRAESFEIHDTYTVSDYGCPDLLVGHVFVNGVPLFRSMPIVLGDASTSLLELYWIADNVAVDQIRAFRIGNSVYWIQGVDTDGEPALTAFEWVVVIIDAHDYDSAFGTGDSRSLAAMTDAECSRTFRRFLEHGILEHPDKAEYCIPALCDDATGCTFVRHLTRVLLQPEESFAVGHEVLAMGEVLVGGSHSELRLAFGVSEKGGCVRVCAPIEFPLWITSEGIRKLYAGISKWLR